MQVGSWARCDCDSQVTTRSARCVESLTGAVLADGLCASSKPATQQPCTSSVAVAALPCPDPGLLSQGWSTCSEPCGGGTQYRLLECIEGAAIGVPFRVPAEACNFTGGNSGLVVKVSEVDYQEQRACNTAVCPEYHYFWGDWGRCSATCGGGVQVREARIYLRVLRPIGLS